MATELGKFLRKIRIEKGELLLNMANTLGVSSAFLSRVENGKKRPPQKWEDQIIASYGIVGDQLKEFREVFFDALNCDSINISNYSSSDRELMLSFARKFDSFDREEKEKLKKFLAKEEDS